MSPHGPLVLLFLALLLPACQFPRDVDGTLSKIRGGEIRAGIVPNDPWVTFDDTRPGGVEVVLLEQFARRQGAEVRWVRGAESELIEALEGGQLDVVIGGLTRDSTHQQRVTLTRPYATTEAVLAAPRGVEVPDDLDGVRVAVEAHSPEAAELERQTDAEPVPLESIEGFDGPVVIEDHRADDLGLVKTDRSLIEEEHVFAVAHGENAFLTELEHFLLDRGREAMRMLDREDAP